MAAQGLLYRAADGRDYTDLDVFRKAGGYAAARKALGMTPAEVAAEVQQAALRGRGGAGFPAATKWSFVPRGTGKPIYLVVNADEGEPGTFKDRYFLEHDPHRLLEGCMIAAWAVDIRTVYIYIRGEFVRPARMLQKAIDDARKAGLLFTDIATPSGDKFRLEAFVHRGAGAYICGEETALLDSMEGKPGQPRLKPPFPAVEGLFGCPTVVNNVETIASLPLILERGGKWWLEQGRPGDGGLKVFGVSGHVKRPGLYERPMGYNLKKLIFDDCGGTLDDRPLKLIIPGGSSTPCLLPDEIDVDMTFDGVSKVGSMMGTAGVIVATEGTCAVQLALRLAKFYSHESCGQCTPCREGTGWIRRVLERFENGMGTTEEIDLLLHVCDMIEGNTICALGDACAMPVRAILKKFRSEFEEHVRLGRCPYTS